jgi:hypothetical protein
VLRKFNKFAHQIYDEKRIVKHLARTFLTAGLHVHRARLSSDLRRVFGLPPFIAHARDHRTEESGQGC